MAVDKSTRNLLLEIYKTKKISLEGNIVKVFEADADDVEFKNYLSNSLEKDKENRRKRLEITKQIQERNRELLESEEENKRINEELKIALNDAVEARLQAEQAKDLALTDLDVLQKKSQTELISTIVRVSLFIILSVGVITTIMYSIALIYNKDVQLIGTAWSNTISILLTNSFSIVGTIMGIKYASENKTNKIP